ncbi:hypothetical protein [Kitasatospora sp. A2-31]|uniref:hypothetical protein n=1 Tax=Kitasatospora sp. A2-31 TaxID=2916414 RepID=UPI001EEC5304|nr:hypothetical protein [Kitasatospora sp. A2-31]MCG6497638.1 hypothetical protein [Kitasatospora sp. A2-31]
MTNPINKLLAEALGHASQKVTEAAQLGRLEWKNGGLRCYSAQRDGTAVLTLVAPRLNLAYEIVGIDVGDLQ